jgi:hypothetical protein
MDSTGNQCAWAGTFIIWGNSHEKSWISRAIDWKIKIKGGIRIADFTFISKRKTVFGGRFWKKQGLVIR